jgi:predicted ATPase/class 3 adenylate cyclase
LRHVGKGRDDASVAAAQPSGTVTLVFTDIEGSTRLLEELGTEGYREALAEHRRIVREACARHAGYEVDTEGDAFFYAFQSAQHAVEAVGEAMRGLDGGTIRIRVGLHTGEPALDPPNYLGIDVHRAARIMSCAHGGQAVLSSQTVALLDPGSVELVALGSHRLKDINEPVSLFQLGVGNFPALRTLANTNLPTPVSGFVGRETELAEADRLLRRTRLLTVTGPGGAGKTRFAVELAHRVRRERFGEYPDGVFACFLSTLRDPALVLPTIAHTLAIPEQAGSDVLEALVARLDGRRQLLLLDNLEHLLEAAPALSRLLAACPGVSLLCTSRETLRLQGEATLALPPLAERESVALVCERARVESSESIRELCLRLEGLPLALELAAARLSLLSPEQLLQRLSQRLDLLKGGRDSDPRQQTLRATIQWSHDLLDEPEQRLFARLAVFAGGCTLDAAEQVCGAELDTLHSLIDKSLVRFSEDRYWMLETIREYAAERLSAAEDSQALEVRHAEYFLAFAEEKGVRGAFDRHVEELDQELDNFRAALETFRRTNELAAELRLARALARLWYRSGHLVEGMAHLERALEHADAVPAAVACDAHGFASYIATDLGDRERMEAHAHAELVIARSRGGPDELADALLSVACVAELQEAFDEARRYFEASLETAREADYQAGMMVASTHLADLALYEGDVDRAAVLLQESIGLVRASGWTAGEASGLVNLARARLLQGRTSDAAVALREAAEIVHGLPQHLASWLEGAAAVLGNAGDDRTAARLLGAAAAIRESVGSELDHTEREQHGLLMQRLGERLGDSFRPAWHEGGALSAVEAVDLALASLELSTA